MKARVVHRSSAPRLQEGSVEAAVATTSAGGRHGRRPHNLPNRLQESPHQLHGRRNNPKDREPVLPLQVGRRRCLWWGCWILFGTTITFVALAIAESGAHGTYYRLVQSSPSLLVPEVKEQFIRKSNSLTYVASRSAWGSSGVAALDRMTDDEIWRMGDSLPYGLGVDSSQASSSSTSSLSPLAYVNCSITYKGVLLIRQTDLLGGAGTALLQLVLGQLLYASDHHLLPWIHLDNSSHVVYDRVVHASPRPQTVRGTTDPRIRVVTNVTWIRRPIQYRHPREATPGPPSLEGISETENEGYWTTLHDLIESTGTDGIWDHYFEPVNPHRVATDACASFPNPSIRSVGALPHVTLPLYLITPGLHGYSVNYATQAWRYDYLPSYVTQPHLPLHQWLEPRRTKAHRALQQFVRFRPHLHEMARRVNPNCHIDIASSSCLGLHIRHSDKAAGRRILQVQEFLPYVQAFVNNGGQHVYVATDSTTVWDEIQNQWPDIVKARLRALHLTTATANVPKQSTTAIHRSSDRRAVFDLAEDPPSGSDLGPRPRRFHHDTNQQALVEILALSRCQFLVHGMSAMSEAAVWINLELHNTSVNLEADSDEDEQARWTPALFGGLVRKALAGEPPVEWPHPSKQLRDWWNDVVDVTAAVDARRSTSHPKALDDPCLDYDGVLHVRSVRKGATTASAFFIDVANQLLYAERYRLLPLVHLDPNDAELIYDPATHMVSHRYQPNLGQQFLSSRSRHLLGAPLVPTTNDTQGKKRLVPGKPHVIPGVRWNATSFVGSGIWDHYFEPLQSVSHLNRFRSCQVLPVLTLSQAHVASLALHAPWALRAWRYDGVPPTAWEPQHLLATMSMMRNMGHQVVERYYRFRPYLLRQAVLLNSSPKEEGKPPTCLSVHIRVGPKPGKHRSIVKADAYLPYLEAFVRGGGDRIFVSTDSHRALHYVQSTFPEAVRSRVRSSGRYTVRSQLSSPSPDSLAAHLLDSHHRVNAEALADLLAMAGCDLLLHSSSTVADAAAYLNRLLASEPDRTINLELPEALRPTPAAFEELTRQLVKG